MKELSKERFSLLNEDQKLDYIAGSSIFSGDIEEYSIKDELFSLSDGQLKEMINGAFYDAFGESLEEKLGPEEYNKMLNEICTNYKLDNQLEENDELNESFPGIDAGPILPNMKWIGLLAGAALLLLGGLIKILGIIGQQIAIMNLKRYMKKLVELIDNGTNKGHMTLSERWSNVLGSAMAPGSIEANRSCFKTAQKYVQRNMCNYTAISAKSAGLMKAGGGTPAMGGLTYFNDNYIQPLLNSNDIDDNEEITNNIEYTEYEELPNSNDTKMLK